MDGCEKHGKMLHVEKCIVLYSIVFSLVYCTFTKQSEEKGTFDGWCAEVRKLTKRLFSSHRTRACKQVERAVTRRNDAVSLCCVLKNVRRKKRFQLL